MGFSIVEGGVGVPSAKWFPVSCVTGTGATVYEGQLVKLVDGDGIEPLTASGASPAVILPIGVVVAVNNRTPTFSTVCNANYATAQVTQATELARDYFGAEGMFSKGEPSTMAKVALIDRSTVLEGTIFKTSYGTAPTVLTLTTGSAAGITGFVHNTADSTLTTLNNMYYCRSGLNKGLYRSSYAGSATTPTFYRPWPYASSIGDTFVATPFGLGRQMMDFNSIGTFIDNAAAYGSSYYYKVDVLSINLATAGQEKAQFRFVF